MALADLPDESVKRWLFPIWKILMVARLTSAHGISCRSIRAHHRHSLLLPDPRLLICPDDDLRGRCQCGKKPLCVIGDSRFRWG